MHPERFLPDGETLAGSIAYENGVIKLCAGLEYLHEKLGAAAAAAAAADTDAVEYMRWLHESKAEFALLLERLPALQERVSDADPAQADTDRCKQLVENVNADVKLIRPVVEVALEFIEILEVHMETLLDMIDSNIHECFAIQDARFASPVRHTPAFTLTQVVKLLASSSRVSEPKVPIFTPLEEELSERFNNLIKSVNPIRKSLIEILPQRMQYFKNRNGIAGIDQLYRVLQKKYKDVMKNYRIMSEEINELQTELVDKRWNILFINLNNELSFLLDEIVILQNKILKLKDAVESAMIRTRHIQQLEIKCKVIGKTLNVIYRALEFSLLDAGVASRTNELAQRWIDIREVSDEILSSTPLQQQQEQEEDINHLDELSLKLEHLQIEKENETKVPPKGTGNTTPPARKLGAALLKKMNIKPVMITGTPTSVEKTNPFIANNNNNNNNNNRDREHSGKLNLSDTPALPYYAKTLATGDATPTPTPVQSRKPIEEMESEKLKYYSQKDTNIPTLKLKLAELPLFHTTPTKPKQQYWAPYGQQVRRTLKAPTPVSNLLPSRTS